MVCPCPLPVLHVPCPFAAPPGLGGCPPTPAVPWFTLGRTCLPSPLARGSPATPPVTGGKMVTCHDTFGAGTRPCSPSGDKGDPHQRLGHLAVDPSPSWTSPRPPASPPGGTGPSHPASAQQAEPWPWAVGCGTCRCLRWPSPTGCIPWSNLVSMRSCWLPWQPPGSGLWTWSLGHPSPGLS